MGIDVGVVKISYLQRPEQPMYDFLWELAAEPHEGDWGGWWEGNVFTETTRTRMLSRAAVYAVNKDLSQNEVDKLLEWVENLPWNGDTIMLHLGW